MLSECFQRIDGVMVSHENFGKLTESGDRGVSVFSEGDPLELPLVRSMPAEPAVGACRERALTVAMICSCV